MHISVWANLLWTQLQWQEASQEFQTELENTPGYSKADALPRGFETSS